MDTNKSESHHIPDTMIDLKSNTRYKKGRFFGKGGFARCYEITDERTNCVFAGKIVSKALMTKHNQKEKMTQEIAIHQSLGHKNVVGFHSFFEDVNNVYIVLELCTRRSMMELHKRRKAITEPEARYYLFHILQGLKYLHEKKIIHRDLKLGNLFLDENLQVKIGDFGLAAKLDSRDERKRTLCGTPNYIAPEILTKSGHSFEVDMWSVGCILYTLLVGKPPFETSTLKETYSRIKRCEYRIPSTAHVSHAASQLICQMLQSDPAKRPTVKQALVHEFFTSGYHPRELPVSCLTMPPRFDTVEKARPALKSYPEAKPMLRKPLHEKNEDNNTPSPNRQPRLSVAVAHGRLPKTALEEHYRHHLKLLLTQLSAVVHRKRKAPTQTHFGDECTDPAAQPIVWISKWVDYSDKYGFGYQLSDECVGVMFNDTTKMVLLADNKNVHYINKDGQENYHQHDNYPPALDKKMKLLSYFRRYMNEHLVKAGAEVATRDSDKLSRMPYLYQWFRTNNAVVMHLTNGTLQINFTDHTKIILCPLMKAVTFIDLDKALRTFRFANVIENGCCPRLDAAIQYSYDKIKGMIMPPPE